MNLAAKAIVLRYPFPKGMWDDPFLDTMRDLGAVRAKRRTDLHPNWYRCDGSGFTIWVSEPVVSQEIDRWEIRVETLSELPPLGEETLTKVTETLTRRYSRFGAIILRLNTTS